MLDSEKLGIAARLHVLLRRKTGRVTDTEWMATNAEYAAEVVRFANAKAVQDSHPELADWADKLAAAMAPAAPAVSTQPVMATLGPRLSVISTVADMGRYVRGIR